MHTEQLLSRGSAHRGMRAIAHIQAPAHTVMFAAGSLAIHTLYVIAGCSTNLGLAQEHNAHQYPQHGLYCHSSSSGESDSCCNAFFVLWRFTETLCVVCCVSHCALASGNLQTHVVTCECC